MVLVDTSVWIDFLQRDNRSMQKLLEASGVLVHPLVIGELACGNLANRTQILIDLQRLPQAPVATDDEALRFIEGRQLMGKGIGYIEVHLLASVQLAGGASLWTQDRRLAELAGQLGVCH